MDPHFMYVIADLYKSDEVLRCCALEDLCLLAGILQPNIAFQMTDEWVLYYLFEAIHDSSTRVRETAVEALRSVGGPIVAQGAAALMSSEEVQVRNSALEILGNLGPIAISAVESYLDSPSRDVRKFAIDTIAKVFEKSTPDETASYSKILDLLGTFLLNQDGNIAGAAAEALGYSKNDSAVDLLLPPILRADCSSWLQCNIIAGLARIASVKSRAAIEKIDISVLSVDAQSFREMALNGEVL